MKIKPIHNDADYSLAKANIRELRLLTEPTETQIDELMVLIALTDHYSMGTRYLSLSDPIDAIHQRMKEYGMTSKDLVPYMGHQSKVSEVLNKKRKLTLNMIRKLHVGLKISLDCLITDYPLNK